jgi:hypothetical protein
MEKTPTSSRPHSPESPFRSADHVLHFDDDLTDALNTLRNFTSRTTTPLELACCCKRENCESLQLWKEACHKLEKELVLSAGELPIARSFISDKQYAHYAPARGRASSPSSTRGIRTQSTGCSRKRRAQCSAVLRCAREGGNSDTCEQSTRRKDVTSRKRK